jgi:thiamine-phosphate pyrophosphorylase
MVQLRDKTGGTEAMIAAGRAIRQALAGTGVPLIVNDDVAAAQAIGAEGVHLGQSDMAVTQARAALGPDTIIGLSVTDEVMVRAVDPALVDYVGIGPVFPTPTKQNHNRPIGFDGLARLVAMSPLPAVAIGGLKAQHAHAVLAAGAAGLAVVSAICGQPDPEASSREIASQIAGFRSGRG